MAKYPLPSDTATALGRSLRDCRNPGLIFDRYTPHLDDSGDKQRALKVVRRCRPDRGALQAYRARLYDAALAAGAITFQAATDWRFVTGIGRNTPFEVGFTFQRLYGFPVIPGSSLKGLARSWACLHLEEASHGNPEEDPRFVAVFGTASQGDDRTARAGGAVFFQAVPMDDPNLDLDVMTPHYSRYYGQLEPPTDGQNPIPIAFLTVQAGVRFRFAVGWRGDPDREAHARAVEWLKAGLKHLGAGAKTAAGYGYFNPTEG